MTDMKHVTELLQTGIGTEGQLLIPRKIADRLVEEVDKFLIPRSEAAMVFGPGEIPGSSIDVDLETPDSMATKVISEWQDSSKELRNSMSELFLTLDSLEKEQT